MSSNAKDSIFFKKNEDNLWLIMIYSESEEGRTPPFQKCNKLYIYI